MLHCSGGFRGALGTPPLQKSCQIIGWCPHVGNPESATGLIFLLCLISINSNCDCNFDQMQNEKYAPLEI